MGDSIDNYCYFIIIKIAYDYEGRLRLLWGSVFAHVNLERCRLVHLASSQFLQVILHAFIQFYNLKFFREFKIELLLGNSTCEHTFEGLPDGNDVHLV